MVSRGSFGRLASRLVSVHRSHGCPQGSPASQGHLSPCLAELTDPLLQLRINGKVLRVLSYIFKKSKTGVLFVCF